MVKNNHHTTEINVLNAARDMLNFVVKYRYLFSLILFLLLVVLKVNGSSLMCWERDIDLEGKDTVIFGAPNYAKSYEYKAIFPAYFSQQLSDTPFSLINYDITPGGQNVLAAYGAPVLNIYTLSKPCLWGFFFLPSDFALAWFWDMKMILMLLLGFEFSKILTRGDRLLSVLGALWISLSPAVMWNFSDSLGEVILYSMAVVVTFSYFCRSFYRKKLKILFAALFSLSLIGFLTPVNLYFQIPFGILTIILVFLVGANFKGKLHLLQHDRIILISTSAILLLMILNFAYLMKGVDIFGGNANDFSARPFMFLTNVFTPYQDIGVLNQPELASFINFLPAALCALPILLKKSKVHERKFGVVLAVYSLVFLIVTLLRRFLNLNTISTQYSVLAFSYSSMLLSIWAIAALSHRGGLSKVYAATVSIIVGIAYFAAVLASLKGNIKLRAWVLIILAFALLNFLLLRGNKKEFAFIAAIVILVAGLPVNPLNVGAGAIMKAPLSKNIRKVDVLAKGARWLAIGSDSANSLIYANGAKTLGGYNAYPDLAKWKLIDKEGVFKEVYNRSAMVTFNIEKGAETNFTLTSPDAFYVTVTTKDLKALGVDYIVCDKDLSQFNDDVCSFVSLFPADARNYTVYSVNYKS